MTKLIGKEGGKTDSRIGFEQLLVSMGHQSCGALTLWNYPNWMRNLVAQDIYGEDRPNLIDMAALESKSNPCFFFYITNFLTICLIFPQFIEIVREEFLDTTNSERIC